MLIFKVKTMKTYKIISILSLILSLTGCSPEDDIKNPTLKPLLFSEDFAVGAADNTTLNTQGWANIAEVGSAKWTEQIFSGNPYAEFSSFRSSDIVNISWLISPKINMDANDGEILVFRASQSFVSSAANSLEVLVSSNFDGANVTAATWTTLSAILPTISSPYFEFIKSGEIDLSSFSGNINIAFKVKGSGTNTALDGSYQIDDIRVFTK
jgi:hypothetical protein